MELQHPIFNRYPDLKELVHIFRHEMQQAQRPANEIILNDQSVMKILKISKRKLEYMKAAREIPYSQSKQRSCCYYLLSDILAWIEKNRVNIIEPKFKK